MSHPSAILRGKVLTLPLLNVSERSTPVEAVAAAAMRRAHARTHVLVTLSEGDGSLPRVLTVSGPRQRTLPQWNAILAPDLIAAGVTADWGKALVLVATSGSTHES